LYRKPLLDLKWRDYAARIDAGEDVDIPVNPPPWHIRLHARQVDLSR
jgi:hypothetical protein